jgi:hypothetical protein
MPTDAEGNSGGECRRISSNSYDATLLLSVNIRRFNSGGEEASIEIYSRKRWNTDMLKESDFIQNFTGMTAGGKLNDFQMCKNLRIQ